MSNENDDDIAVLTEPPSCQNTGPAMPSQLQRFHITTGEVTDPGSVHALKTANEALKKQVISLTQDHEQMKANFRLVTKRLQRQDQGSSLPTFDSSHSGLKSKGATGVSNDSGFGSSGLGKSQSEQHKKEMDELKKTHQRELHSKDKEINDLQVESYRLMGEKNNLVKENEDLKKKIKLLDSAVSPEVEQLRQRNLALGDENEKLLKEKTVAEKHSRSIKKDLVSLNKDYSECKMQLENAHEVIKTQKMEIKSLNQKVMDSDKMLIKMQSSQKLVPPGGSGMSSLQSNISNSDMVIMSRISEGLEACKQTIEQFKATTIRHQTILKGMAEKEKQKSAKLTSSSFMNQNPLGKGSSEFYEEKFDDDVRWPNVLKESANVGTQKITNRKQDVVTNEFDISLDDEFPMKYQDNDLDKSTGSLSTIRQNPEGMCTLPNDREVCDIGESGFNAQGDGQFAVSMKGHPIGQSTDHPEDTPENQRRRSGSPKVCPTCHLSFPSSMSTEEFQIHILDCDPSEEMDLNRAKECERVCPMCNAVYPATVPQIEYEQHVMHHFDNEEGVGDFVMP